MLKKSILLSALSPSNFHFRRRNNFNINILLNPMHKLEAPFVCILDDIDIPSNV